MSPFVLLAENSWLTSLGIWPALLGTMVLFYFLFIRPQSRARAQQEKSREEKLKNLKKNDRVLTIGGIYGVVTHVEPDKNEIVIRVDDTNNTRLHVVRTSIHDVISEEPAAEPPKLGSGT
ncbi:MAG: preprotein translocase subunit YajC [Planctomycetia bacterium]|nr:preprotein translocase subunit YajC [Planctomycetia bacterium]